MRKLTDDLCAMPLHRRGQPRIMRDRRIIGQRQILRLADPRGMKPRGFVHDQPDAALRASLMIGDQRLARTPLLGEPGLMPGREDAIADLMPPEAERREQMWEAGWQIAGLSEAVALLQITLAAVIFLLSSVNVGLP